MSDEHMKPRAAISVTRKVNLGNHESADVFIYISGLTADTTDEEIKEILATTAHTYDIVRRRVQAKAEQLKENR